MTEFTVEPLNCAWIFDFIALIGLTKDYKDSINNPILFSYKMLFISLVLCLDELFVTILCFLFWIWWLITSLKFYQWIFLKACWIYWA